MSWDFDYSSISSITSLLNENGLSMTKKFGQNFLISASALDRIINAAQIDSSMKVWEVGPGIGALTTRLVNTGAKITAFEIDRGFCKILKEKAFTDDGNFALIEGDALKNWKNVYKKEGTPDIICANLPYNVGSVFIANLIENRCLPKRMVFTLQSEVVQRITSSVGDDQYSGFSLLTSIDYINKEVAKLKSHCFWPAPNVDSSVVLMDKRETGLVKEDIAAKFIALVRVLFAQRRKTVKNNLKTLGLTSDQIDLALEQARISQTQRAETLSITSISALAQALMNLF